MSNVDKNNPETWIKYRAGLCNGCNSGCCTMPVEVQSSDLVRLGVADENEIADDERGVARRLIKEGIVRSYREKTGLFTLVQKSNDDCLYLGSDRRCTVYERRPNVCRKFPLEMSRKIGFCPAIKK